MKRWPGSSGLFINAEAGVSNHHVADLNYSYQSIKVKPVTNTLKPTLLFIRNLKFKTMSVLTRINNVVQLKQNVISLAKVAAIEKNPGYHNRFNALSNY